MCVALLPALSACARPEPLLPAAEASGTTTAGWPPPRLAPGQPAQVGYATWYGNRLAGRKTADGERFDPNQMTAAHRTLPFGTWVEVRRLDTGQSVCVRVTDRGPFGHEDRIIDLSRGAAEKLGMLRSGIARVELRVVAAPR